MPYTPGASLASGPYSAGGTQTNQQANNAEIQYQEATLSFEQDLFTPFVFSGCVATKDGTTASQLDVTAGVAFLTQSDLTERRQAPTSTTFSTSGHPSTTMYLFLKNDGTYSWQTSSTGPTNSLAICQVTTDGSSNIATVTDKRVTATTIFSGMAGNFIFPNGVVAQNAGSYLNSLNIGPVGSSYANISVDTSGHFFNLWAPNYSGVGYSFDLHTWDGSANHIALHLDPNGGTTTNGRLNANLGLYVFPNGTGGDDAIILYDKNTVLGAIQGWGHGGAGFYIWDNVNSGFVMQGGTKNGITFPGNVTTNAVYAQSAGSYLNSINLGPAGSTYANISLDTVGHSFNLWTPQPSGTAYSLDLHTWSGSAAVTALHLDPSGYAAIGVIRNGTAQLNKFYTGSSTPSSPAVGDVWLNQ